MSKEIETRLTTIELRLEAIERALGVTNAPQAPQPEPKPDAPSPWEKRYVRSAEPEKPANWLGVVAVICFVMAAGLIVKLSIDSGWLTPARQVGLAVLFGFSLMGTGFALMKHDRAYASLLPGAGIIVLYLSGFAAHRYYGLITFEVALAVVGAVSALCIWLYTYVRHDVYAVTAAVGSYTAPVIMGLGISAEFSLYYFLLCSVSYAYISVWLRSRLLTVLAAYLSLIMTALVGADLRMDKLVAFLLPLHFMVFSLGTALYSRQHRTPMTSTEAWSFLPVLLVFYAMEYFYIERIMPGRAPLVSLLFAGVLLGIYHGTKRLLSAQTLQSGAMLMAFNSVVLFHSLYLELLPAALKPWLFVVLMLAYAFAPAGALHARAGMAYRIPYYTALLVVCIEYLDIVFRLFETMKLDMLVLTFAAFMSVWAVIMRKGEEQPFGHTLLISAHLLAVMGLYNMTVDIGSLAVSASWLFYAVAVMSFAFQRRDELMAKSALFVLSFAAGKALLYDAAAAPAGVRIFCLLLTGAVLYGCGLLMRKIAAWKTE